MTAHESIPSLGTPDWNPLRVDSKQGGFAVATLQDPFIGFDGRGIPRQDLYRR
jgi:hypothetical protein